MRYFFNWYKSADKAGTITIQRLIANDIFLKSLNHSREATDVFENKKIHLFELLCKVLNYCTTTVTYAFSIPIIRVDVHCTRRFLKENSNASS